MLSSRAIIFAILTVTVAKTQAVDGACGPCEGPVPSAWRSCGTADVIVYTVCTAICEYIC